MEWASRRGWWVRARLVTSEGKKRSEVILEFSWPARLWRDGASRQPQSSQHLRHPGRANHPNHPNQRNPPDIPPTLPTVPNHPGTDPRRWSMMLIHDNSLARVQTGDSGPSALHTMDSDIDIELIPSKKAPWSGARQAECFATARAQASWLLLSTQRRWSKPIKALKN